MSAIDPTSPQVIDQEIRAAVQFEIGKEKMKDFELWAFRRSPVTYDDNAIFLFQLFRSTKTQLPENNMEAIAKIIHLWKHRHDWKLGGC